MNKILYLSKSKIYCFIFLLLFSFSIPKAECKISMSEFYNYFNNKTIDRIRQIFWNIIIDLENEGIEDIVSSFVRRSYAEEYLHSISRYIIMKKLEDYQKYINKSSDMEIDDFVIKMNDIDIFKLDNIDYLFSDKMPRHFLINFAVNIDKYERIKKQKIDGINDYINYLHNDKIIEYLKKKLSEYKDEISNNFDEIILNNINIEFNTVQDYFKNKTKEELIDIVYGVENYFFNVMNKSNDAYYFYQHDDLINTPKNELYQTIALYNKEISIDNIDDFMYKIEFRNFTYIVNKKLIELYKKKELTEKILILEKYYKRQMNQKKSLRGLNEYVNETNMDHQRRILSWGLSLYPELYCDGIFQDISSSEINLKYGEVKDFIEVTERDILLRYAYNIHTYQNKISSIYNEDLYNIYRYKNDQLYEIILSDTNNNRNLQSKNTFLEYADLKKDNLYQYIENLEYNQLKKILRGMIYLYYQDSYTELYKKPSELSIKLEVLEYYNRDKLISEFKGYIEKSYAYAPKTSDYLEANKEYLDDSRENYIGYYNNIYDFLKSTNIRYLKYWLSKYENYYRRTSLINNIQGGLKYNYMNTYTKEEILEIFDIYINQFPNDFEPEEFIKFVGLDNGITPHQYLVQLFNSIGDENVVLTLMRIGYSLTGYYQRKNIQTSFNIEEFIRRLNYTLTTSNEHSRSFVFQFFRIINMFPELNNQKIFEILCLNNNTRVIYMNNDKDDAIYNFYLKRDTVKIAKNIQYYYNNTNQADNKSIDDMDDEDIKRYILGFVSNSKIKENYELKGRILDGYFSYVIYDYFQLYLNNIDEQHLNFIFKNIKSMCQKNYPCNNISDAKTIEEKKAEIIKDIKYVQEFQSPVFFDKNFDYIESDGNNFTKFLINSDIKDLKLYTIMTYIIKLEELCEDENDIMCKDLYSNFDYQLFTMSKNEMIRYILKESEINKDKINEEMLPILVQYYMLDLGSDNIYDLTLY